MQDEMCGQIRPLNSGQNQCVTVKKNKDLDLTNNCDEKHEIFCYNSTSKFLKLQGNDTECVTGVQHILHLMPCDDGDQKKKWTYRWTAVMAGLRNACWKLNTVDPTKIEIGPSCTHEFDFQLTTGPGLFFSIVKSAFYV